MKKYSIAFTNFSDVLIHKIVKGSNKKNTLIQFLYDNEIECPDNINNLIDLDYEKIVDRILVGWGCEISIIKI